MLDWVATKILALMTSRPAASKPRRRALLACPIDVWLLFIVLVIGVLSMRPFRAVMRRLLDKRRKQ